MSDTMIDTTEFDVIIVGAGIIGCACAASLSANGLAVCVIEPNTIGGGATAAGMGHLVVMDDNPTELALSSYSLELWRNMLGQDPQRHRAHEYSQCGTIWVAADEEEMHAATAKQRLLQEHGISCEILNQAQLYRLEPELRTGLAGGLLVHQDGLVYPPKSAECLLERAIQAGAQICQAKVTALQDGAVMLDDGRSVRGREIVVANGIAAMSLIDDLPLRYKKGHLLITDRYPNFIQHQLVELAYIKNAHASDGDSVAFNLQPRPTGQVFIGSSRQFDVQHKEIDIGILSKMLRQATSYVPALSQLRAIRTWTGFRAATPDGLPYIGAHPNRPHVWVATGHEGLGITTSLATAEILTNQICGEASKIPIQPYWPDRMLPKLTALTSQSNSR
ncbi:FAD-binding oxidoreductase [Undibacterium sp. FT137W]|uniref:FAD-binding oxidoreductase n=2 Tax=Undibacterium fentianense TaxID=2828728 RepID=A0A941ICE1_9BURK|nr:FAD-binding oxidoreductase [Undibacterium fentianense]